MRCAEGSSVIGSEGNGEITNLLSAFAVLQMAIDGIVSLLCPLGGVRGPQARLPLLLMLKIQVMQAQATTGLERGME